MAKLFADITELHAFVGGGINYSIEIENIDPTVEDAASKYIIPWIDELYTDIRDKDTGTSPYNPEDLALIPYIQKALAPFTLFEYAPIGSVQFSGAGFVRTESENVKSAYKYQENNYKDKMLENGYERLENLILFIENNKANYPKWTGELREKSRGLFINTAKEFRSLYSNYITRWTFEVVRPVMEDIEEFAIWPVIGEDLFEDLKTKLDAGTLSDNEKKAVRFIQKAIVSLTIREAEKRHWVRMEGNKLIYNERSESQSGEYQRIAMREQLETLARSEAIVGNRYISRLLKLLNDHTDDFTGWPIIVIEEEETTTETDYSDQKIIRI